MNVSITPAPARTDGLTATGKQQPRIAEPEVRRLALGLSAGALAWSVANFAYGFEPGTEAGVKATDLTGFAFQLGVLSLVTLQLRTRATGTSRKAAAMLKVERVLLGLAMVWSLVHGLFPTARDEAWLAALDVFWPLSMLGMFVIGIKVAAAGRWCGAARWWPLGAESWAVVTVPALVVLGHGVADIVGAAHLLVGYVTLGLIIALRPGLVLDRS